MPVGAPIIISVGLIYATVTILQTAVKGKSLFFPRSFWLFEIAMGIGLITTFLICGRVVLLGTIPSNYPWLVFWILFIFGIAVFEHYRRRTYKTTAGNFPADR